MLLVLQDFGHPQTHEIPTNEPKTNLTSAMNELVEEGLC